MCKAKSATALTKLIHFQDFLKYEFNRKIFLIFLQHSNLLLTLERSIWSWSLAKLMEMQGHHQISSTGFRLAFCHWFLCLRWKVQSTLTRTEHNNCEMSMFNQIESFIGLYGSRIVVTSNAASVWSPFWILR